MVSVLYRVHGLQRLPGQRLVDTEVSLGSSVVACRNMPSCTRLLECRGGHLCLEPTGYRLKQSFPHL